MLALLLAQILQYLIGTKQAQKSMFVVGKTALLLQFKLLGYDLYWGFLLLFTY